MIAEIAAALAPVAGLAGVAIGARLTGRYNRDTAQAQSNAAAELAARGPRKQAYAEFIHAVRGLLRELNGLLPELDDVLVDNAYEAPPERVRYVCGRHFSGIDTAHAVIRLEGPTVATNAATIVLDRVEALEQGAEQVEASGELMGYQPGFTNDIREALDAFAETCARVLNESG